MEGQEEKKLISQKEYLKKYLSKDKKEKKKKKKKVKISSSTHIKRSVIIDDDLGLGEVADIEDQVFNLEYLGDEAPQIAGVIDERPLDMIWKPIGGNENKTQNQENENVKEANSDADSDISVPRNQLNSGKSDKNQTSNRKHERRKDSDSDVSVDRIRKQNKHRKNSDQSDSDQSPPRKSNKSNGYDNKSKKNSRRNDSDSDLSPPRSRKHNERGRKRKGSDSDQSPPRSRKHEDSRRKRKGSDSDLSPSRSRKRDECGRRRNDSDSDLSPPRSQKHEDRGRRRKDADSDLSPPRHRKQKESRRHNDDSDQSVERRPNKSYRPDRFSNQRRDDRGDWSRNNNRRRDYSPPRRSNDLPSRKNKGRRSEDSDSDTSVQRNSSRKRDEPKDKFAEKTADGKKAGLQSGKTLKEELRALKEKENQAFSKLDPKALGQSAAPIVRDRKTGLKRDLAKEQKEADEKNAKVAERKNKYDRWGKGLKQIRDREEQLAETVHEMSKPLARYKDDADLDRYLKAQEREGDPMLDYIRQQQIESHKVIDLTAGTKERQRYQGAYMPNRFGIPPGYRWDGVDRSNGYEKKWFETKSAKKALEEEAYKWSSADM